MSDIKPLSLDAIPKALERADRYRLLNEPTEAQSICLDVLAADPENQRALVTMILALTDQLGVSHLGMGERRVEDYIAHLKDEYDRTYYAGVVCERRGKHAATGRMSRTAAYEWFRDAMAWYEKAEKIRPPGNDDALLRWNTCARILKHNQDLQPEREERVEYLE
jgi:hypothetical protein